MSVSKFHPKLVKKLVGLVWVCPRISDANFNFAILILCTIIFDNLNVTKQPLVKTTDMIDICKIFNTSDPDKRSTIQSKSYLFRTSYHRK